METRYEFENRIFKIQIPREHFLAGAKLNAVSNNNKDNRQCFQHVDKIITPVQFIHINKA